MATYSIYHCTQPAETATTGLTEAEVIKTIYRDDGQDYMLEPRMEKVYDGQGEDTGETVQAESIAGLEWDVRFKSSRGQLRLSNITAYGATEEEAELDWLNDCFRNCRYETSKWAIQTDDQYQADLLAAENDQE
jgi:hypothetical protein